MAERNMCIRLLPRLEQIPGLPVGHRLPKSFREWGANFGSVIDGIVDARGGRVKGRGKSNGWTLCFILGAGGFDASGFSFTGGGVVYNRRGRQPPSRICLCAREGTAGNFPLGSSAAYQEAGLSFSGFPNSEGLGGRGLYSHGGKRSGSFAFTRRGRPFDGKWHVGGIHTYPDSATGERVNILRISDY